MANWTNPFSFRGDMGRLQFWLTLIVLSVVSAIADLLPVNSHELVAKSPLGQATAGYATPIEPLTFWSAGWFVLYVASVLLFFWLTATAVVQRLNDLGVSWKWAAGTLVGFVAAMIWSFAFAHSDPRINPVDVAGFILWLPVCLVGGVGMFMMYLVPGYRSRRDRLPDNDLRKNVI